MPSITPVSFLHENPTMPDRATLSAAAAGGVAALEEASAHVPRARRNLLVGLWAGQQIGLADAELARFAATVMAADHEEVGDADVIRALRLAFMAAGLPVPEEAELARELATQGRLAYAQILSQQS
jgi:hypothetical protein